MQNFMLSAKMQNLETDSWPQGEINGIYQHDLQTKKTLNLGGWGKISHHNFVHLQAMPIIYTCFDL